MGLQATIDSIVTQGIALMVSLVSDFTMLFAVIIGLAGLGAAVSIFRRFW